MESRDHESPHLPMDDEISLIDLATTLGQEKKTVFGITLGVTLAALTYSLLATPIFTAKTLIMLPQQQQTGAAAAMAQLGALTGVAGLASSGKSPDETYLALLKSNSIRDDLIEHFKLKEHFETKTLIDSRKALEYVTTITSDKKSGTLTVEVDDPNPDTAASLANGYVDGLHRLLGRLAVTEAQQRRLFFEQQIANTTTELTRAETQFRMSQESGGMQVTDVLAESSVKSSAELRGQIAAREVELSALNRFATAENPEVQRLTSTLSALRVKLNQVEKGSSDMKPMTESGQAAVAAYRDVKTRQAILEVMVKQYEMAKVDEAREGPVIQQVDIAQPPERKSKPKRLLFVSIGALIGLFMGILVAFIRHAFRRSLTNPQTTGEWSKLKDAWTLRRQRS